MRLSHYQSFRFKEHVRLGSVRAALGFALLLLAFGPASAESIQRPSWDAVALTVAEYCHSLKDYKNGDLLNQSFVAAALDRIAVTGWKVPKPDAIIELALAENSFLVKELSTPNGRYFMRQIEKDPGTYSRLDRLSTISHGRKIVHDLIQKEKGGYTLIEYMASTRGGKNLGAMMAGVQRGVDLNTPTGRIYTAEDLLAVLKKAYDKPSP